MLLALLCITAASLAFSQQQQASARQQGWRQHLASVGKALVLEQFPGLGLAPQRLLGAINI